MGSRDLAGVEPDIVRSRVVEGEVVVLPGSPSDPDLEPPGAPIAPVGEGSAELLPLFDFSLLTSAARPRWTTVLAPSQSSLQPLGWDSPLAHTLHNRTPPFDLLLCPPDPFGE
jgi:hypothetical protein